MLSKTVQEDKRAVGNLRQAAKHELSWKGRIEILAY